MIELGGTYVFVRPEREHLDALAELADAGKLRVDVADTYPLEKIADAHQLQRERPHARQDRRHHLRHRRPRRPDRRAPCANRSGTPGPTPSRSPGQLTGRRARRPRRARSRSACRGARSRPSRPGQLRRRLVVPVGDEEHVVAEAPVAPHLPDHVAGHLPVHHVLGDPAGAHRVGERHRAAEPRRTALVRHVLELGEQQLVVRPVVLRGPRPARREHARHPVERVDAQAAVVGERGKPVASTATRALISALPSKVGSVSAGSS